MPRKIRQIRVEGNIAYVPLTKGYEAVIDADDADMIGQWNWSAKIAKRANGSIRNVYAGRKESGTGGSSVHVKMHRFILQALPGCDVDHQDNDGLNNRRMNLRSATRAQNQYNRGKSAANTSGYKGVSFHKKTGKWQATIRAGNRKEYLGLFTTPEAAHAAYATASNTLHGEFWRTS